MNAAPLQDCRVLYTRASIYYPDFAEKIHQLGGIALHLPLIDTRPLPLDDQAKCFCQAADYLIFTSAAAVRHFSLNFAPSAATIAIGPATAKALQNKGISPLITASAPFNSESLLQDFAPSNKNIAIIAAQGGRTHLIETLQQHNRCRFIFVYQRYNPSPVWSKQLSIPDAMLLSSHSALDHLIEISTQETLNLLQSRTAVFALSPRIGQASQHTGFQHVFAAKSAEENAQIQQLCHWWQQVKEH